MSSTPTVADLVAEIMTYIEDIMTEAEVDYPAGSEAGPRISYDSDAIAARIRSVLSPAATEPVARFGFGNLLVDTGSHYGTPAVFIGPSPEAGPIGENARPEHKLPTDRLVPGEFFMTFPTEEQATRVADALVNTPVTVEAAALEHLQNVMGHIDTPIARRRLNINDTQPEWLVEARKYLAAKGEA